MKRSRRRRRSERGRKEELGRGRAGGEEAARPITGKSNANEKQTNEIKR